MNEQAPEVPAQMAGPEEERKPVVFAVRIDPVLREQIEGLRGITEQSVNDVGVEALNDWVTKTLGDEAISQKAMAELDAEEQRLQERRAAIAGILGQAATATETSEEVTAGRRGRQGQARPRS
ncbi:hypothetical protein [Streptomyces chartreusis]|uniref:Uncharacterized protein n=1 Tax=Streptomyces chartreusis TaxID=1969 RepID=A0A7H8THL3_STRCX|nr:hypothetical protein [Streptomyces chartreusis]QKZ22874.1 hypothetical protein HUT05_39315 [Streptomyces chartreusis]